MLTLSRGLYTQILICKEYEKFLLFKPNLEVYIDIKKLPKKNYIPINDSYINGFLLTRKINKYLKNNKTDLIQITYGKRGEIYE